MAATTLLANQHQYMGIGMTNLIITQRFFAGVLEEPALFLSWYGHALRAEPKSVKVALLRTAARFLSRYKELQSAYNGAKSQSILNFFSRSRAVKKTKTMLDFLTNNFFNWILKSIRVTG